MPPIRIIRPDNTRELSFWSFFLGVNLLVRFLVFSASKVICLVGRCPAFFLGVNLLVRFLGFSASKVICLVGRSAAQFQKFFLGVNLLVRFQVFSASKVICLVGRSAAQFQNSLVYSANKSAPATSEMHPKSVPEFFKIEPGTGPGLKGGKSEK